MNLQIRHMIKKHCRMIGWLVVVSYLCIGLGRSTHVVVAATQAPTFYQLRLIAADAKTQIGALSQLSAAQISAYQAQVDAALETGERQAIVTVYQAAQAANAQSSSGQSLSVYRAYNPNSGDHLYTPDAAEYRHTLAAGWQAEGVAWQGATSGQVLYRLYNPQTGEHFYTVDAAERQAVLAAGWREEFVPVAMYAPLSGKPVYRLFNPYTTGPGSHHFTLQAVERAQLVAAGWREEGVAFMAVAE